MKACRVVVAVLLLLLCWCCCYGGGIQQLGVARCFRCSREEKMLLSWSYPLMVSTGQNIDTGLTSLCQCLLYVLSTHTHNNNTHTQDIHTHSHSPVDRNIQSNSSVTTGEIINDNKLITKQTS